MKKIVIGRSINSQVRLEDDTDTISRRQAVITVSFFGKMQIYDTSAHGTYVNGEAVPIPEGRSVTRKDKVNFCNVQDLDWSLVRDPYRRLKMVLLSALITLLLLGGAAGAYFALSGHDAHKSTDDALATDPLSTDSLSESPVDSLDAATPTATSTQQTTSPSSTTRKTSATKAKRAKKSDSSKGQSARPKSSYNGKAIKHEPPKIKRGAYQLNENKESAPTISSRDLREKDQ